MNQKVIEFNKSTRTKKVTDLQTGDVVRVHKRIKEGEKERVQVFQGMVIAIKANQSSSPMITVRRESQGVGVEITFPLYLSTIEKVELLRHSKIRRSKLYYMRSRTGKAAKMKVKDLTETEKNLQKELDEELKMKKAAK
jgi:large subunit ribosomal protein L19